MRETEYAFGVARIRANETGLLTKADMDQLIAADSYDSAVRILTGKGWQEPAPGVDMCESRMEKAWQLISESVPDPKLLDAMIIGNDFTNVKAAVKAVFSGLDGNDYVIRPSVCDPALIVKAVNENNFSDLPDYLAECADEAYHTISGGKAGQYAEMIIDKACLETRLKSAEKAESKLLVKIIRLGCVAANAKIALRSARTGKTEQFALDSMCRCDFLDNNKIVAAAFSGEPLGPIVSEAGFPEIAEEIDKDFSALEMKCDNLVTQWIESAKYLVFGPDPLIAYFYAETAEVRNVRIILSAKAASVPTETIQQRVRDIYV